MISLRNIVGGFQLFLLIQLLTLLPPANEVWGKVMLLYMSVILSRGWLPSMHHRSHDQGGLLPGGSASREGSASRGWMCIQGGSASGGVGQTCPPANRILQDTVNKWAVRILLECILVL